MRVLVKETEGVAEHVLLPELVGDRVAEMVGDVVSVGVPVGEPERVGVVEGVREVDAVAD